MWLETTKKSFHETSVCVHRNAFEFKENYLFIFSIKTENSLNLKHNQGQRFS